MTSLGRGSLLPGGGVFPLVLRASPRGRGRASPLGTKQRMQTEGRAVRGGFKASSAIAPNSSLAVARGTPGLAFQSRIWSAASQRLFFEQEWTRTGMTRHPSFGRQLEELGDQESPQREVHEVRRMEGWRFGNSSLRGSQPPRIGARSPVRRSSRTSSRHSSVAGDQHEDASFKASSNGCTQKTRWGHKRRF